MFKPHEIVNYCAGCKVGLLSASKYCFRCFMQRMRRCPSCRIDRRKGKRVRIRIRDGKEIEMCGACGNENFILLE